MLELRINQFELIDMDAESVVKKKLTDAGFDITKDIAVQIDFTTNEYVYTQINQKMN